MSRIRVYANAAERTRAYRLRLLAAASPTQADAGQRCAPVPVDPQQPKRPKVVSRPKRLAALRAEAQCLQQEHEHWLEVLPESLQETDLATRLAETIEQFAAIVDLIDEIQLPRGFGRD
jgi:hypothetical protein